MQIQGVGLETRGVSGEGVTQLQNMATNAPTQSETGPTLEDILSRHGLKEEQLDTECPRDIRDEVAVELGADWEMIGRYMDFSLDQLRDISRENSSQEMCRLSLLDTWHKREGRGATFLKLVRAFHRRKRRDLVDLLCMKLKCTLTLIPVTGKVPSLEMPPESDCQQQRFLQQPLSSIARGTNAPTGVAWGGAPGEGCFWCLSTPLSSDTH